MRGSECIQTPSTQACSLQGGVQPLCKFSDAEATTELLSILPVFDGRPNSHKLHYKLTRRSGEEPVELFVRLLVGN